MGVELVEGRDLVVQNSHVCMKTTKGYLRIDVLYRRLDDTSIDPLVFNPGSLLGIPGIMDVCKKGNVALANAPGTGVADDKAVYAYVPDIVKYYLNEEIVIPNVPTYICRNEGDRKYVLDNLDRLVVKSVNESGAKILGSYPIQPLDCWRRALMEGINNAEPSRRFDFFLYFQRPGKRPFDSREDFHRNVGTDQYLLSFHSKKIVSESIGYRSL